MQKHLVSLYEEYALVESETRLSHDVVRAFLQTIIHGVFNDGNSTIREDLPLATKVLISNGVTKTEALEITLELDKLMMDIFTRIIPDITFNDKDRFSFQFIGKYDLEITVH